MTPAHLLHGHRIMLLPHQEVREENLQDPTYGSPIASIPPWTVSFTMETRVSDLTQGTSSGNWNQHLDDQDR